MVGGVRTYACVLHDSVTVDNDDSSPPTEYSEQDRKDVFKSREALGKCYLYTRVSCDSH